MRRSLTAEFVGSALLTVVVVGSGIAAQDLSPHQSGLELLENAVATGAGLYALISALAPISGAHFNPLVTVVLWRQRRVAAHLVLPYVLVQVVGCVTGALLANALFGRAIVTWSTHQRFTGGHALSEAVATFGLLVIIELLLRSGGSAQIPAAVGAYVTSAYFFASSTSFANPAITVGRMFTDSFAGIAPTSVPGFVGSQCLGAVAALAVLRLFAGPSDSPGLGEGLNNG